MYKVTTDSQVVYVVADARGVVAKSRDPAHAAAFCTVLNSAAAMKHVGAKKQISSTLSGKGSRS
jgi:hypothetical protein